MPILIILYISDLLLYAVIPVTIVFPNSSIQVNPRRCKCGVTSYYLKQLADRRLGMLNKSFSIYSDDELFMLLENLDVLEVEERNGKRNRSRKLPIQRGNALRYLYIKKEKVQQLM